MSGWMGRSALALTPGYRVFKKTSNITGISPSDTIVLLDQRSDSIDDGVFGIDMAKNQLMGYPSGYHNGASGLTFADGHAEIHKWRDARTLPMPIAKTKLPWSGVFSPINQDVVWLQQHATVKN